MNRKKVVPETEPELSSFYPDTEDGASAAASCPAAEHHWLDVVKILTPLLFVSFLAVETIVITPFLPVVAFGRPLPKLSQQ